jgi:hypothetical protein
MYWAGTPNCPSIWGSAITAAASAARILIIIVLNFPLSIKIYSSNFLFSVKSLIVRLWAFIGHSHVSAWMFQYFIRPHVVQMCLSFFITETTLKIRIKIRGVMGLKYEVVK